MNIALIGTGDMGGALALAFSRNHRVTVTASRPGSESARQVMEQSGGRIRAASRGEAVDQADVVVLAVPWTAVDEALEGGLPEGKILLVVTVPWVGEGQPLTIGTSSSGAEYVAAKVPGARVLQAFNTAASTTVAEPNAHGMPATVIVSGDDADAKEVIAGLAREVGFDVVDAGYGEDVAFRVLRGEPGDAGDPDR